MLVFEEAFHCFHGRNQATGTVIRQPAKELATSPVSSIKTFQAAAIHFQLGQTTCTNLKPRLNLGTLRQPQPDRPRDAGSLRKPLARCSPSRSSFNVFE